MAKKAKEKLIETICGTDIEKIRKAYFDKKLPELFNEIQATKEWPEGEVKKLGVFLELLRVGESDFVSKILVEFKGKIVEDGLAKPPTVDELRAGMVDTDWREKADKAIVFIESVFETIRTGIAGNKKFEADFWNKQALTFISMQDIINKDLVFKDQLYRARLTKILDSTGCSRAEAEERARMTKEYFDKEVSSRNVKRMEEFYTFARRRDDQSNYRG